MLIPESQWVRAESPAILGAPLTSCPVPHGRVTTRQMRAHCISTRTPSPAAMPKSRRRAGVLLLASWTCCRPARRSEHSSTTPTGGGQEGLGWLGHGQGTQRAEMLARPAWFPRNGSVPLGIAFQKNRPSQGLSESPLSYWVFGFFMCKSQGNSPCVSQADAQGGSSECASQVPLLGACGDPSSTDADSCYTAREIHGHTMEAAEAGQEPLYDPAARARDSQSMG